MDFNNVWIFPDGTSRYTNKKSHMLALQEFGVQEELYENAKNLEFSHYEKLKHYDTDVAYIAMKIGYIRVLQYKDQLAVEYIGHFTIEQCRELIRLVVEMQQSIDVPIVCYQLEEFQSKYAVCCNSFLQFKQLILNKVE